MNIASNETSGLDVVGKWIKPDEFTLNIRLNEDGMGDTEIDYIFNRIDLEFLRDILTEFLDAEHEA